MRYSIHVGLNRIDPQYYGSDGALRGCINDVNLIRDMFNPDDSTMLLNEEGTVGNFLSIVREYARIAKAGDTVLINYSGHGTQIPSTVNLEKDRLDEAFCFYDRLLLDKQFSNLISLFEEDVVVIAFIDSCFSGGISRMPQQPGVYRSKALDTPYQNNQKSILMPIKCSYIGLLACAETQTAMDGKQNGLFTGTMAENFQNQPLKKWIKDAKRGITIQTFTCKTYGEKNDWQNETFVPVAMTKMVEARVELEEAIIQHSITIPTKEGEVDVEAFFAAITDTKPPVYNTEVLKENEVGKINLSKTEKKAKNHKK